MNNTDENTNIHAKKDINKQTNEKTKNNNYLTVCSYSTVLFNH